MVGYDELARLSKHLLSEYRLSVPASPRKPVVLSAKPQPLFPAAVFSENVFNIASSVVKKPYPPSVARLFAKVFRLLPDSTWNAKSLTLVVTLPRTRLESEPSKNVNPPVASVTRFDCRRFLSERKCRKPS